MKHLILIATVSLVATTWAYVADVTQYGAKNFKVRRFGD